VLDLAEVIWKKMRPNEPFRYVCDEPFTYDVQKRVPDTAKAKAMLGFEARTSLETALDEIVPWIMAQIEIGGI